MTPLRVDQAEGSPRAPASRASGGISVVIPAYNHERFIGEAIDSVRAQTLRASELLVVDDGSSDGTRDVLADHAFDRMQWIAQPNRGAHAAINRAIALTSGDYVAILNSDDAFEPERLEHAWAVARGSGAALVFGSVRLIDGEGGPLSPDHDTARWYRDALGEAASAGSLRDGLRHHNVAVTTSNFFLLKELWCRLGGFRSYRYAHDYDFLLRAIDLCPRRVSFVPELCDLRYRVHEGNTIAESAGRATAERIAMLAALRSPARRLRRWVDRPVAARSLRAAIGAVRQPAPVFERPVVVEQPVSVGLVARSLDRGGLEEVVALLAQSLSETGIRTSVLCTDHGGAVADRLRASGVPVTVASGGPDEWRAWVRGFGPAVLSSHFTDVATLEVLAESGVPIVETIHNTYVWFSPDDWAREASKRPFLAGTIAVSETVARYQEQHGAAAGPTRVVPNAVHPARAARVPREMARRLHRLDGDGPVFVSHGRLTAQKNPGGLLAAFAEVVRAVPDARLVLAGPVDDARWVRRLKREHRALLRAGSVRIQPPVSAVGSLLSAADAFVSDSFYEGWSIAASEALWVGIPVVLSECGGAAELVGPGGQHGYLVPNPLGDALMASSSLVESPPEDATLQNRRALADALVALSDDRDAWRARASEIRAYARRALGPERFVSDYARVLSEVVAGVASR